MQFLAITTDNTFHTPDDDSRYVAVQDIIDASNAETIEVGRRNPSRTCKDLVDKNCSESREYNPRDPHIYDITALPVTCIVTLSLRHVCQHLSQFLIGYYE